MTVVTTAPTYLFWRCAPPELRVPRDFLDRLAGRGGRTVAVGPHGSATPGPTLRKLGVRPGGARRDARRWWRASPTPTTGQR